MPGAAAMVSVALRRHLKRQIEVQPLHKQVLRERLLKFHCFVVGVVMRDCCLGVAVAVL